MRAYLRHYLYPPHGLSVGSCPAGDDWMFDCKYAPGYGAPNMAGQLCRVSYPNPWVSGAAP